ncbi:MAG: hypothetical protein NTNFB02_01540 [Nitrospira sp.]
MKVEAVGTPFIYRWPGGEVRLEPGQPVDLPPDRAAKLLARAGGRVRLVNVPDPIVMESASTTAKPIYWEQADGRIVGPATPEFLAMSGSGPATVFWVVATVNGQGYWIRADRLRSRAQYERHGMRKAAPCRS